jgi:hypothetical protein
MPEPTLLNKVTYSPHNRPLTNIFWSARCHALSWVSTILSILWDSCVRTSHCQEPATGLRAFFTTCEHVSALHTPEVSCSCHIFCVSALRNKWVLLLSVWALPNSVWAKNSRVHYFPFERSEILTLQDCMRQNEWNYTNHLFVFSWFLCPTWSHGYYFFYLTHLHTNDEIRMNG